jgi:hypothetical protein
MSKGTNVKNFVFMIYAASHGRRYKFSFVFFHFINKSGEASRKDIQKAWHFFRGTAIHPSCLETLCCSPETGNCERDGAFGRRGGDWQMEKVMMRFSQTFDGELLLEIFCR